MELKDLLGDAWKDGMSMEDVTNALKDIQLPTDQSAEIERLKESLSKSNSEAADWKKQFRATQDEATRKAAEAEESSKKLLEEVEKLRKEKTISGYKASYLGLGYGEKDAGEIAQALSDGQMDKVFEIQKRHQEAMSETIRKELLKDTHRPGGGGGTDGGKDEKIELAKALGKARAESNSADVLKQYAM